MSTVAPLQASSLYALARLAMQAKYLNLSCELTVPQHILLASISPLLDSQVAAMVFRLLTNNILGLGEGGKGPAIAAGSRQAAALRARAVQFAKDALK